MLIHMLRMFKDSEAGTRRTRGRRVGLGSQLRWAAGNCGRMSDGPVAADTAGVSCVVLVTEVSHIWCVVTGVSYMVYSHRGVSYMVLVTEVYRILRIVTEVLRYGV